LLGEILDPSKTVDPKWRTRVVVLDSGRTVAGLVLSQTDSEVRLVSDPTRPEQVQVIPRDRIEEMRETPASLMPAGLLDGLGRDEVLDLLARLLKDSKGK
jgi:putative heme-binding domain-containing protein